LLSVEVSGWCTAYNIVAVAGILHGDNTFLFSNSRGSAYGVDHVFSRDPIYGSIGFGYDLPHPTAWICVLRDAVATASEPVVGICWKNTRVW